MVAKKKAAPAAKAAPAKKAAPKKKEAAEVVTLPVTPPPVKEEEKKEAEPVGAPLPAPDKLSATGPSAKYPFGIKITQGKHVAYERFERADTRDMRLASFGKRAEVEAVDYKPLQAPAPKAAPKGPQAVPDKPKVANINKRITEGAEVKEWRWVRSLRQGYPGFFAQGGHYKRTNRGNEFVVGEEHHFKLLADAQRFVMEKAPTTT